MKDLGLFGLTIPQDYGGLGLNMEEEVLLTFKLGRAAPAFRSAFATTVGIGPQGIVKDGTEEQKRKYLARLATGASIGSFAQTETCAGPDAQATRSEERRGGTK